MSNHAPARVIRKADRRAQRRLHRVFVENTYTDPNHPLTLLYHEAERLLDRLKRTCRSCGFEIVGPDDDGRHPDCVTVEAEIDAMADPRWAWEAAEWRGLAMGGEYADATHLLPDVPLADPGDHYAGMPS